jgi:hypothetical protein
MMPSKSEERLDRRDFMIASVATIGASAGLVVDARSQNARSSAPPVSPASGAPLPCAPVGEATLRVPRRLCKIEQTRSA